MEFTKIIDTDWKYKASKPYASGMLTVSEEPRHDMHWEEYGNPKGEPVIFVHGGPGGGCSPDLARFFNPERYRIILYDQRGCGQSVPHVAQDLQGAMDGNITANLVEDIEKLREDRGISGPAHIFGGSWGSTLAMAYKQAHPDHVQHLILRGIFLCDKTDLGFFYQGNADTYAQQPDNHDTPGTYRAYLNTQEHTIPPELSDEHMAVAYDNAWHHFVTLIPEEERGDMIAAYHRRFNAPTISHEDRLQAARAWWIWEGVTSYLNHDVSDIEAIVRNPEFALAIATIENEYFYRSLRGEDQALSTLMSPEGIATLASGPISIVQGAYDQVCVPASARKLKAALLEAGAENLDYRETVAGHSMTERTTNAELTDVMDHLPRMWEYAAEPKGPLDHATRAAETRGRRQ